MFHTQGRASSVTDAYKRYGVYWELEAERGADFENGARVVHYAASLAREDCQLWIHAKSEGTLFADDDLPVFLFGILDAYDISYDGPYETEE